MRDVTQYDGLPSVTQIISRVFGKKTAPSARVAQGTDAHTFLEQLAEGHPDAEPTDGYQDAVLSWVRSGGARIVGAEIVVKHPELGYAGQLDLLCRDHADDLWVVDLKTRSTIWEHSFTTDKLQVRGYAMAYEKQSGSRVDNCGTLLCRNDGTWLFDPDSASERSWLAMLELYHAMEADGLE